MDVERAASEAQRLTPEDVPTPKVQEKVKVVLTEPLLDLV
jgi:hypothetical protein